MKKTKTPEPSLTAQLNEESILLMGALHDIHYLAADFVINLTAATITPKHVKVMASLKEHAEQIRDALKGEPAARFGMNPIPPFGV